MKFLDNLNAVVRGRAAPHDLSVVDISHVVEAKPADYQYVVDVEVRLGVRHVISYEEELLEAKKVVKRAIIDQLYGELKSDLIKIQVEMMREGMFSKSTEMMRQVMEKLHE